jgi:hypothetical protein
MANEWQSEYLSLNEQFKKLQELHDEQKKIIARLQEENQSLKEKLNEYTKTQ